MELEESRRTLTKQPCACNALNCLSGNICTLHPSPRPTAHPCTTHRTLSRRSILTHRRRTPCTYAQAHARILRARLPPSREHPRLLFPTPALPISRSRSTSSHHNYTPMRAQALFALSTGAHGLPLGAARRRASRAFILAWRVYPSLHNRYASRWRTGYPSRTVALVLERSPAGEKARLLLSSAVSVAIVVWGCIRL